MTTRQAPQCLTCAHYRPPIGVETEPGASRAHMCDVFPDEIPWPIWDNEADHRRPVEGDNGRRWEPAWPGATFPEWAMS